MSELVKKIEEDLKKAMIVKEAEKLSVLRMLKTAIKNKEISMRTGEEVKLSDEQVIETIKSEVKKRNDSILLYEQGARFELAEKEKNEIKILEKYLPPALSDAEIERIVKEVVLEKENKNFGEIMKEAMVRMKGGADGGRVSRIVREVLEQ